MVWCKAPWGVFDKKEVAEARQDLPCKVLMVLLFDQSLRMCEIILGTCGSYDSRMVSFILSGNKILRARRNGQLGMEMTAM